jgi:hypothetical protein
MSSKEKRTDLNTIIRYRSVYAHGGGANGGADSHYYLSSRSVDAEEAGGAHPGTPVYREPAALVFGCMLWGGRLPGPDESRCGESECAGEDGSVSTAEETGVPGKRFGLSRKMLRATPGDDSLHDLLFGKVKCRCPVPGTIGVYLQEKIW